MSTQEILDRLKAVCEAANDGPYEIGKIHHEGPGGVIVEVLCGGETLVNEMWIEDAQFLVLSCNAVSALVEALEQVRITTKGARKGFYEEWQVADMVDEDVDDALATLKDRLP